MNIWTSSANGRIAYLFGTFLICSSVSTFWRTGCLNESVCRMWSWTIADPGQNRFDNDPFLPKRPNCQIAASILQPLVGNVEVLNSLAVNQSHHIFWLTLSLAWICWSNKVQKLIYGHHCTSSDIRTAEVWRLVQTFWRLFAKTNIYINFAICFSYLTLAR